MSINEASLTERAIAGDQASLEQLLVTYHGRLIGHLRNRVPPHLAGIISLEDVVQQAYVQAWLSIGSFTPRAEHSTFAWLKIIAERKLMDACRRHKRERIVSETPPHSAPIDPSESICSLIGQLMGSEASPDNKAMVQELMAAFQVALAGLPAEYREVVQLRYIDARPPTEVAQRMNRSEDAIRGICHRARDRLREDLMRLSRYI